MLFKIPGIKIPLETPDITLISTMVGLKYSMAHIVNDKPSCPFSSHQKFTGAILDKDFLSELELFTNLDLS